MTSIYKTAYPYYSAKKKISEEILVADYRLTHTELSMIKKSTQEVDLQLGYGVLLMVFKNLGYFPKLTSIPTEIADSINPFSFDEFAGSLALWGLTTKRDFQFMATNLCLGV